MSRRRIEHGSLPWGLWDSPSQRWVDKTGLLRINHKRLLCRCLPSLAFIYHQLLCTPLTGIKMIPYVTEPIVESPDGELNFFK